MVFVGHPELIWGASGAFAVVTLTLLAVKLYRPMVNCLPTALVSLLWLGWGFWEQAAVAQRANIRVDLMFLLPFVCAATILLGTVSVTSLIASWTVNASKT